MQAQPAQQGRVYRFPLGVGDNAEDSARSDEMANFFRTKNSESNRGRPLTAISYALFLGAPALGFIIIAVLGLVAHNEILTTVPAGWATLLWFLTLVFYVLFDLPWYLGAERMINAYYYKYHGTDEVLRGGPPGRLPLMIAFFPLAATSNMFLVILPSIEHPGKQYAYTVTAFRAMINGAWCYGTLGLIQGLTWPRFPLELTGLVFLSGSLLSLFTSLSVVGIAQAIDVTAGTNSTA